MDINKFYDDSTLLPGRPGSALVSVASLLCSGSRLPPARLSHSSHLSPISHHITAKICTQSSLAELPTAAARLHEGETRHELHGHHRFNK